MHLFMSVNLSIFWLGITASPLCVSNANHLQQNLKDCKVSALTAKATILNTLKCYDTLYCYTHQNFSTKA